MQGRVRGLQPEAQDDGKEPRAWTSATYDPDPQALKDQPANVPAASTLTARADLDYGEDGP